MTRDITYAETVGFEPTEEFKPLSTLAGWCTRPNYATSPLFVCHLIYRARWGRIQNGPNISSSATCPPFGGHATIHPDA
jgi:hypothetical protein